MVMFVFLVISGAVTVGVFENTTGWEDDVKSKSQVLGACCIISSLAYLADTIVAICVYRTRK